MNYKQFYKQNKDKIKSFWQKGLIQLSSRITYDIFWNVILFFLVIGFIGLFFAGGIGAGYFASLVKDEPVRSYSSMEDRKSTRLNSSHVAISYAVFCLKKKNFRRRRGPNGHHSPYPK